MKKEIEGGCVYFYQETVATDDNSQPSGPPANEQSSAGKETTALQDTSQDAHPKEPFFVRKAKLTVEEIVRADDNPVFVVMFSAGTLVLRSTDNPLSPKIRQLEDRIGIVGIGADWTCTLATEILANHIDGFLSLGYTRADIWGHELGEFLSKIKGLIFSQRPSKDEDDMSLFPCQSILFEIGNPVTVGGKYVEMISFDGHRDMPTIPVMMFWPRMTSERLGVYQKVIEIYGATLTAVRGKRVHILDEVVLPLVGRICKTIRENHEAPFFECVFLSAFNADEKDYKRVWITLLAGDVEGAIAEAEAEDKARATSGGDQTPPPSDPGSSDPSDPSKS